ncbi:hypothetical protein NW754_009816 [Fusarium falciforme]|nr:hypothetical protein NW754_009816 [Fusarium falciforme]
MGICFVLVGAGNKAFLKLSWSYTRSVSLLFASLFVNGINQIPPSHPAYRKVTMHLYPSVKDSTNPVMLDDPALASRVQVQSLVCFYALVSTSKASTRAGDGDE